jgi:hypothetical protein
VIKDNPQPCTVVTNAFSNRGSVVLVYSIPVCHARLHQGKARTHDAQAACEEWRMSGAYQDRAFPLLCHD